MVRQRGGRSCEGRRWQGDRAAGALDPLICHAAPGPGVVGVEAGNTREDDDRAVHPVEVDAARYGIVDESVPGDLDVQVQRYLRKHPAARWDEAVASVAKGAK